MLSKFKTKIAYFVATILLVCSCSLSVRFKDRVNETTAGSYECHSYASHNVFEDYTSIDSASFLTENNAESEIIESEDLDADESNISPESETIESEDLDADESNTSTDSTGTDSENHDFYKITIVSESTVIDCEQDGCIYNDYLFSFDSIGNVYIYSLSKNSLICASSLPNYNNMMPHSNSVCFGKKYHESDPFPLLYTNIYNNYPNNPESYGVCLVYRIEVSNKQSFTFNLIQIIKIGFTHNSDIWCGSERLELPFGNFLVLDDSLWVYVSIFKSSITRFFKFDIPSVCDDALNCYILNENMIQETFDLPLFRYMQGGTASNGFLYSLEGFGTETCPGFLRIINLESKNIISLNLRELIGSFEPELIDIYQKSFVIGTHKKTFFVTITSTQKIIH